MLGLPEKERRFSDPDTRARLVGEVRRLYLEDYARIWSDFVNDIKLIRAYLDKYGYTFAAAPLTPQVALWFGRRRSLPELYVVDKSGHVVLREEGEMFPEDVAALVRFASGA